MLQKVFQFANKPFLWFILLFIFLAYLKPDVGAKGGLLKPEITIKYFAVSIIFFISGVSLKTQALLTAAYQIRLHVFIQLYSLVFIPFLVQFFVQLLGQWYPKPELLIGFIMVSCMPPPVSSAVLLTKTVGGNEAAAVFNSALGSFLGIIVTPGLLYIFFNGSSEVPVVRAIFQLFFTVVFPVAVGQYLHQLIGNYFLRKKQMLSRIGSFMLLLIIYSTFCETFSKKDPAFTFSTVFITTISVVLLQILLTGISFFVTSRLSCHFSPEDVVAAVYCSTHKSLTLGFWWESSKHQGYVEERTTYLLGQKSLDRPIRLQIFIMEIVPIVFPDLMGFPMLKILYGSEDNFILISFPLLIYHPMQILIGSLLVSPLQKWMQKTKKFKNKLYSV